MPKATHASRLALALPAAMIVAYPYAGRDCLSVSTRSLCRMRSLLSTIRNCEEASAFLAGTCDFDLDWHDHVEPVHLASGMELEGFARDGTGGTYFFCGQGAEERPVMYADSEGGAALLAIGMPELVQLLLVAPGGAARLLSAQMS